MAAAKKSILIFFILFFFFLYNSPSIFLKHPFHPRDILPLLPKEISWPILKSLNQAVDLLPSFVGSASSSLNNSLQWKGACFYENSAWLEFNNESGTQFGGGILHIRFVTLYPFSFYLKMINFLLVLLLFLI